MALSEQITTIRQVLALIDGGAKIVAMTLRPPARVAAPPPVLPQSPAAPPQREPEETDSQETGPEEPVTEEGAADLEEEAAMPEGELTVSTEELVHPPQMMDAIKQQEVKLWQAAYDALAELGVTGVPQPPK